MIYELQESAMSKQYKDRKLSEHLAVNRAERPDEWQMDEYIRMAKKLEDELEALRS